MHLLSRPYFDVLHHLRGSCSVVSVVQFQHRQDEEQHGIGVVLLPTTNRSIYPKSSHVIETTTNQAQESMEGGSYVRSPPMGNVWNRLHQLDLGCIRLLYRVSESYVRHFNALNVAITDRLQSLTSPKLSTDFLQLCHGYALCVLPVACC